MKPANALLWVGLMTASLTALPAQNSAPFSDEYAYELLSYLYRWHMDDAILEVSLEIGDNVVIFYRRITPEDLDPDDNSEFLEVVLPLANMVINLKKSDYLIPKRQIRVRNEFFKVISAQHYRDFDWDPSGYQALSYEYEDMFNYLFETRNDKIFPSDEIREQLSLAARRALIEEDHILPEDYDEEPQMGYIAPVSIASNDLWFFWVNGHMLIHFTSDLEYTNPAFWEIAPIGVDIIELKEEVIVGAQEKSGEKYFTKDYAGRILFNCIVHGLEITPEE